MKYKKMYCNEKICMQENILQLRHNFHHYQYLTIKNEEKNKYCSNLITDAPKNQNIAQLNYNIRLAQLQTRVENTERYRTLLIKPLW